MTRENPLAFVMCGGKGQRLSPLTEHRAKPAVSFGGSNKVVDFALSNLYHSHIRRICVLTQYESLPLDWHVKLGWFPKFGTGVDEFITVEPARQKQSGHRLYLGTADSVTQNLRYINLIQPDIVNVFAGDHIYFMDISQMNQFHREKNADLTISAIPVPCELAANNYGVLVVDNDWQLKQFQEKPENPIPMPGNPDYCLASMGNYTFQPNILLEELTQDEAKTTVSKEQAREDLDRYSTHDFGDDIIPSMLRKGRNICVYDFTTNTVPGLTPNQKGYWRDIGDLDQFYKANMEVRAVVPPINLYNTNWEILTYPEASQPVKQVGTVKTVESIIAPGSIITNAQIKGSVIAYNARIGKDAVLIDSILLGHNTIGKNTIIRNAIIDRDVDIPAGEQIGIMPEEDNERFEISDEGIVIVPAGYQFS